MNVDLKKKNVKDTFKTINVFFLNKGYFQDHKHGFCEFPRINSSPYTWTIKTFQRLEGL